MRKVGVQGIARVTRVTRSPRPHVIDATGPCVAESGSSPVTIHAICCMHIFRRYRDHFLRCRRGFLSSCKVNERHFKVIRWRPPQQVTIEMRKYNSGQHESSFDSTCILASPDLSLATPTLPTPPTTPESVHSKYQET